MKSLLTTERSPPRDPGWLVIHYIFAVATVAILLCLGQVLIQRELVLQEEGLRRTEAVHEQLLLSHRLSPGDPQLLHRFQDNETGLALALADDSESSDVLTRVQPDVKSLLDGLQKGQVGEREDVAAELIRQALETLVVHLNQASQDRLHSLRWTELGILCLVLLTLGAESMLVFRPAVQQIRSLFGELEATRLLLSRRLKRLNESHESIKADLKSAAEVQRSLLPKEAPEVDGYSFAWSFKASHDVAGDMFNLIRLDETHVGVYVLDVSGHGVPAALLSVSLSRTITANLGSLLKRRISELPFYQLVRPSEVARELNRRFPVMSESDQFFTLLYGIIDTRAQTFTFVQAGHPGPIHVTGSTTRTWESAPDPPIGILEEMEFAETVVHLQPGDLICIYTDGVIEARDPRDEMYGLHRVIETLQREQAHGVAACLESLYENMRKFTNGQPQKDDLTLVGFEVTGPPSEVARGSDERPARQSNGARQASSFGTGLVTSSGRYRSVQSPEGPK